MVKESTGRLTVKDFTLGFLSGINLSMLIVIYKTIL